jgi:transposase
MTSKPPLQKRRKYDEDFKAEVLKMVENGQAVSQISKSLGVSENLIYGWKSKRKAKVKETAKGEKSDFSLRLLEENEQLKEKVKQLEMEREILDPMLTHVCWSKKLFPFSAA